LDNSDALVYYSGVSGYSGEPSNNDQQSNGDEQSNGESNLSTGSTREFLLAFDDPEVANYNKIQFLKARYMNFQFKVTI
jgi:hypothetical protein